MAGRGRPKKERKGPKRGGLVQEGKETKMRKGPKPKTEKFKLEFEFQNLRKFETQIRA